MNGLMKCLNAYFSLHSYHCYFNAVTFSHSLQRLTISFCAFKCAFIMIHQDLGNENHINEQYRFMKPQTQMPLSNRRN